MQSDPHDEHEEADDTPFWQSAAEGAVDDALSNTYSDEIDGILLLPDSSGDHRLAVSCSTVDELRSTLEEIYNEHWYANVSFDGGEALFDGDAPGYVSEVIEEEWIERFFEEFGSEPVGEKIVTARELHLPGQTKTIRVDVSEINDELIAYLAKHPERMHELKPRKFEELVAELFRSKGYDVTLTAPTRDGGVDIYALQKDSLGSVLMIIECKRYAADKKVGVQVLRSLYGVVEEKKATKGLIATTSYFSKDAKKFFNNVQFRLALADFETLSSMLTERRIQK